MPQRLPDTDLSTATVGTSGVIDLTNVGISAGGSSANPTLTNNQANVFIYNESGCGLALTFDQSGQGDTFPAGGWGQMAVPLGASQIKWTVLYQINNPTVTTLFATYFYPGEQVNGTNLGNSPVGGTLSTTSNAVANDGNPSSTSVVEATVAGQSASSVELRNQGSLTLGNLNLPGQVAIVSQAPSSGQYSDILDFGNGSQIGIFGSAAVDMQLLSNGEIVEKIGGVQQWHMSSGGPVLDHGTLSFLAGTISRIVYTHIASVTSTAAFFNHNLGVVPDFCFLIPNDGTLSNGNFSAYYESSSMTSTQVKLQSNSVGGIPVGLIAVKL